jgi:hypothetical protein
VPKGTGKVTAPELSLTTALSVSNGGTGSTTASAARTALGGTSVGVSLFTAVDEAAARTALGATSVGTSVFTAVDAAAARTAIAIPTPALVLLNAQVVSAAASVSFSSTYITSTYDTYILEFDDVIQSASGTNNALTVSTNNGSTYESSNYGYSYSVTSGSTGSPSVTGSASDTSIRLNNFAQNILYAGSGRIKFSNPSSASSATTFIFEYVNKNEYPFGAGGYHAGSGAWFGSATAINNIKIAPASGTISGNFKLYGLQKS